MITVSIDDLQAHISTKFQKLGYPIATIKFDLPILDRFAFENARRLNLEIDAAVERARNVWFAIASIQISVGYLLVSVDSAKFPRGHKQSVYDLKDLEVDINIGDLHFWYHHNTAVECAYRVWERLSTLIKYFLKIDEKEERLYFSGLMQRLKRDSIYDDLPFFRSLYKQIDHCSKITGERNNISHQVCRLFGEDKVETFDLPIIKNDGTRFRKLNKETCDLFQVIDNVCSKYKQCISGVENTLGFIKELPA
ncbi:MAG: hypothetical protein C4519_27015 [Desulfobacteraceae bacterium]|nr:MAG: hypothetical protein C4519_27015 [Desulfobacteraceae bacterium]